jgi:hypothetical protein
MGIALTLETARPDTLPCTMEPAHPGGATVDA